MICKKCLILVMYNRNEILRQAINLLLDSGKKIRVYASYVPF